VGSSTDARGEGSQTGPRPRLLVVDDDPEMRELLAEVLSEEGYEVVGVGDGAEALIRLRGETFAAIILDKNMPGLGAMDLLPGLRIICPDTPVIVITAFGTPDSYSEAVEKGAFAYLFKPFLMDELLSTVHRALQGNGSPHSLAGGGATIG
jgi:DNA-binding NtrC family response regulator